ncbi:hypothetical protein Dsin_024332 [Dipteronia sinensis]|uniref:Uncharacterized protein n=1 Tax=Dipteronia sinensis TaxID=43782 RepID=A0AAE0DVY2_9ROSI|nr:hypothetical protein Dsin_024332 [Dipteronia sinensis]
MVSSQPSLSTSGDVMTSCGVVGTIPAPAMVSSGNSSCTVMVVPSGAKSSKVPRGNFGPQVSDALSYANLLKAPNVQVDNLHVWVHFYDLSCEYWHPKIISDLARGIGVPLHLDKDMIECGFNFTRVLVDIDVSSMLPKSLLLERDNTHSSFISVEYENLPAFCSIGSSIRHLPNSCYWKKSERVTFASSELDSFGKLSCLFGFGFVSGSCYVVYCFQFGHPNGFSVATSWAGFGCFGWFCWFGCYVFLGECAKFKGWKGMCFSGGLFGSTYCFYGFVENFFSFSFRSLGSADVGVPRSSIDRFTDNLVKSSVSVASVDHRISGDDSRLSHVPPLVAVLVILSQGSQLPLLDSQTELRFITDSSWASQVDAGELEAITIYQRTMMVDRMMDSYKSEFRALPLVYDN